MKNYILPESIKINLQEFFKNFQIPISTIVPFAAQLNSLQEIQEIQEVKKELQETEKK